MPLYVFKCPKCGEETELLVANHDNLRPTCPTCNCPTQPMFSNFHIRGPWRWYKSSDYGASGR